MKIAKVLKYEKPVFCLPQLVDVILLLLMFTMFKMTSMVSLHVVSVDVPVLTNPTHITPEEFITVSIDEEGEVSIDKEKFTTVEDLISEMREKWPVDTCVVINGDRNSKHGTTISVLEMVQEAGFHKTFFRGEKKKNS